MIIKMLAATVSVNDIDVGLCICIMSIKYSLSSMKY